MTTPWLYAGQTVTATFKDIKTGSDTRIRFYIQDTAGNKTFSPAKKLTPVLRWKVPAGVFPIQRFGFECTIGFPACRQAGKPIVHLSSVDITGSPSITLNAFPASSNSANIPGFVSNIDLLKNWPFSNDTESIMHFGKNEGVGVIATGNRDWTDTTLNCRFAIHAARRAGFVLRYQGLRRYYAVVFTKTSLRIIKRHYGEENILAEVPFDVPENTPFDVAVSALCHTIKVVVGDTTLTAQDSTFDCGGSGFLIEQGMAGFVTLKIN